MKKSQEVSEVITDICSMEIHGTLENTYMTILSLQKMEEKKNMKKKWLKKGSAVLLTATMILSLLLGENGTLATVRSEERRVGKEC